MPDGRRVMAWLNARLWLALALSGVLCLTHWQAYKLGEKNVQQAWDAQATQQAQETLSLALAARSKQAALQGAADQTTKAKNAKIKKLDADLADALERLRQRPARPGAGDLPGDPGSRAAAGCTGAELYRQDAAAFVREAGRADRLLADLAQCQAQHAAARAALQ